jgi:hypothetical protein
MTVTSPFDRGTVVKVWFGSSVVDDDAFILDDPTQGLLDTGGELTGDEGTDIRPWVYDIRITRGRSRELDQVQTGVCTIRLRNLDRTFDALNAEYVVTSDGSYVVTSDGMYVTTGGSEFAPALTPGRRVLVELYGHTIFEGSTEDWRVSYEPHMRTDAMVTAVDALGALARRELSEWVPTDGQMPGDRIVDVLNRSEVAFGPMRDLDTGGSPLQAGEVREGTNVLSYLKTIAETDFGMLFAARDNTLTFRDRYSRIDGEVAATFATGGAGLPIHGIEVAVGSELFYNRVDVTREGGEVRTAEDVDSQNLYGIRKLSLSGLLMVDEEHAKSLAEFLVSIYAEPTRRISAIRVNLAALPTAADRGLVASLDLGSVIDVTAQPLGTGVAFNQVSIIEGIEHSISHGQPHVMTLQLSPIWQTGQDATLFTLDDDTFGLLDGDAVLAY